MKVYTINGDIIDGAFVICAHEHEIVFQSKKCINILIDSKSTLYAEIDVKKLDTFYTRRFDDINNPGISINTLDKSKIDYYKREIHTKYIDLLTVKIKRLNEIKIIKFK
jgi:hypothetical protein